MNGLIFGWRGLSIFGAALMLAAALPAGAASVQAVGEKGQVDWSGGTIQATGFGVCPKDFADTKAERTMAARLAAKNDAYRNLAEVVKGVHVEGETTVQDLAVSSDKVRTTVRAFVQGAQVFGEVEFKENEQGGTECRLTMRAPLDGRGGFAKVILPFAKEKILAKVDPKKTGESTLKHPRTQALQVETVMATYEPPKEKPPENPIKTPPPPKDPVKVVYSGIIVNAEDTKYEWNMFPRVVSEDKRTVFDISVIEKWPEELAFTPFHTSVAEGKNHERVKRVPMVVKAKRIDGAAVYVSNEDSDRILALNNKYQLLAKGHILFVITTK